MNAREHFKKVLSYEFRQGDLFERALTHSSTALHRSDRLYSNERLEFLGDRALGLLVAEWLYRHFPEEEEGDLARRFAALVRRETLAAVAQEIDLGAYLVLSDADEGADARDNPGVLADACEALIGALYLDGGLEAVRPFIENYWQEYLDADIEPPQDAKTALQEWAQGRGLPLPDYRETARSGPPHEPIFTIEVHVEGLPTASAQGPSKRLAEQKAAQTMLDDIEDARD